MNFHSQELVLDLPGLVVEGGSDVLDALQPGAWSGYRQVIPGTARVAVRLECEKENAPGTLSLQLRFLEAHYECPPDCRAETKAMIHRVNAHLNSRLLAELP